MKKSNQYKYLQFRNQYNKFTYEKFDYNIENDKIFVKFTFNLSNRYKFFPELTIHKKDFSFNKLVKSQLDNLVFHIGMIELISYWKAACSPIIEIIPFCLDDAQVNFWKKIYFNGLGEFFYLNGIKTNSKEFVDVVCPTSKSTQRGVFQVNENNVIVPIGGGKDSIVSLELLKDSFNTIPFILNPRKASLDTVVVAGIKQDKIIEVNRKIDPQLLQLNDQGFLNGHTPFSALLGFITLLIASLTGSRFIALSNESSANEPTVSDGANHQYSKSFEFETDFREYVFSYITKEIEYFSFLRPLSEFAIASIFSKLPQHFDSFRSCNVGSKSNTWCGQCPKCLFTAIILSPFISAQQVIDIFKKDILNDTNLKEYLLELAGISEVKPFECVGTVNEVNLALSLSINKFKGQLPVLLEYYKEISRDYENSQLSTIEEMEITCDHFLSPKFLSILKNKMDG